MSIKYKHLKFVLVGALLLGSLASFVPAPKVLAACGADTLSECTDADSCAANGGVYKYIGSSLGCEKKTASSQDPAINGSCNNLKQCDFLQKYLNPLIAFLSALVGVAVVGSIIYGGIQYGSSAGDPQKTAAAKDRIIKALIALLTFMFLFALLNFLVPGGIV